MLLQAAEDRSEQWSEVSAGALYAALTRLERDGLIRTVRTEQLGNYPTRSVFAITASGRADLHRIRLELLTTVETHHDPFDMALAHASPLGGAALQDMIGERLSTYEARLQTATAQLSAARPWLHGLERAVCEHVITRLKAEVRWHRQLLGRLPDVATELPQERTTA